MNRSNVPAPTSTLKKMKVAVTGSFIPEPAPFYKFIGMWISNLDFDEQNRVICGETVSRLGENKKINSTASLPKLINMGTQDLFP